MSDNLGGDALQFALAMLDSSRAALIGLNPVPVLVTALFIGMIQSQRGHYLIKALVALVPAVVLGATWPMALGYQPIWPDFSQPETHIQLIFQLLTAWVVIRLLHLIKATMSMVAEPEPKAKPNGH